MAGPVMLIIRDGWGINPGGQQSREQNGDATLLASTPFHDQLYRDYPGGKLSASGSDVGLPEGQMGNSEVGHLNLGAGRVVLQDLTRINKAIADGELTRNHVAQETFATARGHRLHLLVLVSNGDVVLFFNFRADRARQLSQAFLFKDFDCFDREIWPQVTFTSLTEYDVRFPSPFIFPPEDLKNILGELVSAAGESQLRIAETEKYAHVTYFL